MPLDLPAGKYELIVNWQLYSDITKSLVPRAELIRNATSFVVGAPGPD